VITGGKEDFSILMTQRQGKQVFVPLNQEVKAIF
jgi:hypothetical protein